MSIINVVDEIAELRKLINDTNQLSIALYEKLDLLNQKIDKLDNEKKVDKLKQVSLFEKLEILSNKLDDQNKIHEAKKTKKTRVYKRTAYNFFMKEKMLELMETHPHLTNIERMKMAVEIWNENKATENS